MFKRIKCQRGATLVGVLIAMVVAGIGLYALMQSQGEMTSGISNSKARAQAKEFAQLKIEELHGYIEKSQFTTDLPLTPLDELEWDVTKPDFTHENQTVNVDKIYEEWLIRRAGCVKGSTDVWCDDLAENNPNGNFLEVMVRESWTDEAGNLQSVSLNNFILFKDPSLMASIKQEEDGATSRGTLTRRGRWGDEKAEDGATRVEGSGKVLHTPGAEGFSEVVNLGLNSNGNWEIYLGTEIGGNTVLTSFGGIIHKIEGRLFFKDSGFSKENLAVLGTSPAYCVFPICDGLDCDKEADYACYVPGDCSNEVDDITSINEACIGGAKTQTELTEHLDKIKELELDGGWYGRIGLLILVDVAQAKIPKACLKDLILNDPDDPSDANYQDLTTAHIDSPNPPVFSNDTPARYYAARRILDDPTDSTKDVVVQFEGINTPLACQDILFTDVGGSIKTCQQAAESAGIPSTVFTSTVLFTDPSVPYFEYDIKLRDLKSSTDDKNVIVPIETYGVPPDIDKLDPLIDPPYKNKACYRPPP